MHDDDGRTLLPPLSLRHLATGLFLALGAGGLWICWKAVGYGVGSLSSPAAGSWPLFVGICLVLLCAWLVVVRDHDSETGHVDAGGALGVWLVVIVWALLLNYLTFIAVASAGLFVIFKVFGRAGWIQSILVPLVISVATYVFFSQLLAVPLP